MRAFSVIQIILLSAVVLAPGCGSRPSTDPVPAPVTVRLEPAGTTAAVPGAQGSTLTLVLPAGAVREPVDLVITPLAATADAPMAFTVSPAGLQLRAPATLTLGGGGVDLARATVSWLSGETRSPVQARLQGTTLVATILSFGPVDGGPTPRSRRPRSGAGSPESSVTFRVDGVPMPCEEFLLEQQRLGDAAMASGAPGLAAFYWSAVRSLGIHCPDAGAALIEQQQQAACERLVTAIDNANVVAADTYRGFLQSAGAIIVAEGAVQLRGGSCSADSSAALDLKFAQAALFFRARFSAAQLSGDLEAEFDMLDELIAFDGACQLAGLSVCKSLTEELYPPVLDAIRLGAWDTCQQVGAPRLLGVLFGDALTGARPVGRALSPQGSTQPYMTYADYTYGDLEDDISSCATRLDFHRFDDVLVPGEILPPPASMLPGASPGTSPHEATLDVFIGGSLTLTGKAPLPHCPDGAIPGGALVARVFGKEVGRAPAGSTHYTLDTRPLSLATSDLQAAAAGATQFDLDLVREDVACPSAPYTDPWIVARLHLTAVPPPVDNPLEGTYRGTGMYYSENGCGQCNPFAAVLKISPTPAGLQATVSGNSHVNGTLYSVTQNGDLVSGTSCTSCSEPLAFSAQRTGARLVGFAEWEVGCPGPGCKVTFDVTHD